MGRSDHSLHLIQMAEDVVGVDRLQPLGKWKGSEGWWRKMDSCRGDEGSHLHMALTVREVADSLTCPLLAVRFLYCRLEVGTVTTGPRLQERNTFSVQSQLCCEDSGEQAPAGRAYPGSMGRPAESTCCNVDSPLPLDNSGYPHRSPP